MKLIELYKQIQNPIEDPKVIEELINIYANTSKNNNPFYHELITTVSKRYNNRQSNLADEDRFYSMMFNKWKNSIVAMDRDKFIELYKQGSYGYDFIKMRDFLKTISDVKTKKEADDVLSKKYNDKELEDALNKYIWTTFGRSSSWVHVWSGIVKAKQEEFPNIEHRLYLNIELMDIYKIITCLVKKCDEHHLPYYFKFNRFGNRYDTVVIYSSTENLIKYIECLQEIKKEHPDLVSRAKEPPILTGKVDEWIGYGSEPSKTPDGKNQSFNFVRSNAIKPAIDKTTKKWIMNHRNMQIIYQEQKLTFQDYIAMKSTEKLIKMLEKNFLILEKDKKEQTTEKSYNQNEIIAKLGYSLQDVRSAAFKDNVYKYICSQMGTCLASVCNGTYENMTTIKMYVRNGKQIEFYGTDLERIIIELSVKILKNDPNFGKEVYSKIIENAKQYGIDIDKFCFDIKVKEKMRFDEINIPPVMRKKI